MVPVCDSQCISVLPANGGASFLRILGRFLQHCEPPCFVTGAWVSHLLFVGCILFTRPSAWSLHWLHEWSVLRRILCLPTMIMVSN